MGPTGAHRVLQVHPTRRCNLKCLHCYSSSGPEVSEEMDEGVLCGAVGDAALLGFDVIAVSGGEPLLYAGLRRVLECAHGVGMRTSVTTNGMLLDERRLGVLKGACDLLAISLDGEPASHNVMRANERAFETMASRLEGVRASGLRFGFIFTLTMHNVNELDYVARFAAEQGAALLQIHPLEETGRATRELAGSRPDEIEGAYALMEVVRLRGEYGGKMVVQLDLADVEEMSAEPERVYAGEVGEPCVEEEGGEMFVCGRTGLVSPLVIETDGTVVPLSYGFGRRYALGNVNRERLGSMAARWIAGGGREAFRGLCRGVYAELTVESEPPLVNWYERVCSAAAGGREGAGS